jgi:predicted RNA binding protein YcfA (HicA-like mRNA interferase family)
MIFRNDENIRVTVPFHSGKIIHPKILKKIIEDTGIDKDEFQ